MARSKYERTLRDLVRARRAPAAFDLPAADPAALEYWAAKGCVELTKAWGGEIVDAVLTPMGLTYLDERADTKREKRSDAVRGFFTNYLAGVLSGVTVTLLLEHVIVPLLSRAR